MNGFTTISFPGLGIELNPGRVLTIGSLNIHYYGLIIAFGLVLAVIYAGRRCRQFGFTQDDLLDGVLWVTPFAILCARAYYCIFEWEQYADNPISVLYIWNGGLAIYGGVLGAIVGILVFCRVKKLKTAAVLDLVALGFLIGQGIGRWGNFFNREAFGAPTDSFLRMGLLDAATGEVTYYHPTFLYESLWNLAGFVLLHFLSKKRKYDGQIALGYAAWYGLGRAFIEGLRMDSLYWGQFRVSQVLAAVSCLAAVAALLALSFRPHSPEKLFVNQVAAREAADSGAEAQESE
ncbi:MAG TPA: prolipoprotein diacylglyceryl transferase [Candidatus Faecousia intestinigallinarum]|nr:prolipoprotein diacylglyceryl transferase [Candidatus Faecousia intestinigallinarum]